MTPVSVETLNQWIDGSDLSQSVSPETEDDGANSQPDCARMNLGRF